PPIELRATAVASRRRLRTTLLLAGRTIEPDMEMIIVAPPRPDLCEPTAVRPGLAAQRAFDRGVDEDALDGWLARDGFEQTAMLRRPRHRIDVHSVSANDIRCRKLVTFGGAQPPVRHPRQPNIGIEPDLVRTVPCQHRPAARLRDVAD